MDDGSYDLDLNRFFRACPSMGARSPNTWRSYARDILVWARFLTERRDGKTVWQAGRHDVLAFHRARRLSSVPYRISAASWNRSVAALDKLYRWAVEEGIIAASPFSYGVTHRRAAGGHAVLTVTANRARERAAQRHDTRYIDLGRYLRFRDVGLRGRLPDGSEDPAWRGRNGERNALFAELLVTTGLRLTEAGSLLLAELPRAAEPGSRSVDFDLPGAIAKGGRPRRIRIPRRVLALVADYVDLERTISAARSEPALSDPLWLMPEDGKARDTAGKRARLDRLTPAERCRVLIGAAGQAQHAVLWLTESGRPVPPASWEAAFRRACARCRGFGIEIEVTPHMLRHTFAVNMLSMLIREQIGSVFDPQDRHGAAYRRVLGDPLQKLQHLLGHAIKDLRADCLKNPAGGYVDIEYCKRRARGAEWKRLRVRDGGSSTPGGLLRKVLQWTEPARSRLVTDTLWVHCAWGRLTPRVLSMKEPVASWVRQHGIADEQGQPLRLNLTRLRKTHKAAWYRRTGGQLDHFAVGHTVAVAADHYADIPALRHLHEATIADAMGDALDAAMRPCVLSSEEEAAVRADPDQATGLPIAGAAAVNALLGSEQDVWLASCAGFYTSPFGAQGEACPSPFWGCLECSNAVITTRKLPALLAFLGFIRAQRQVLSEGDWITKFATVHGRIADQILPRFADAEIEEARRIATSDPTLIYLPPEAGAP